MSAAASVPAILPKDKANTIRVLIEKSKNQIMMSLPVHLDVDRLMRLAMTQIQKNAQLLECTPISLIGAIIECAQLGLELESKTNQAFLVPFKNNKKGGVCEATLIVGYKGMETLAIRSEAVKRIIPRAVYKGDEFDFEYGLNPRLVHVPKNSKKDQSEMIYVYAIAQMADGSQEFLVMSREEVEQKARRRSRAADSGPWVTDEEDMHLKTVVRRLCKRLPNTTPKDAPLHRAIALDEKATAGIAQDLAINADPEAPPTPAGGPEESHVAEPAEKITGAPSANPKQIFTDRSNLSVKEARFTTQCGDCKDAIQKGNLMWWNEAAKIGYHRPNCVYVPE